MNLFGILRRGNSPQETVARTLSKTLKLFDPISGRSNALLLSVLNMHLQGSSRRFSRNPLANLAHFLKAREIGTILEVGPGRGELLKVLEKVTSQGGVQLCALSPAGLPGFPPRVRILVGDEVRSLPSIVGKEKVDLILSVGVFTPEGFHCKVGEKPERAMQQSFQSMLDSLSEHPYAACVAVSFVHDFLLLTRAELESVGEIAFWQGNLRFTKALIIKPKRR